MVILFMSLYLEIHTEIFTRNYIMCGICFNVIKGEGNGWKYRQNRIAHELIIVEAG